MAQWLRCCATNLKVAGSIPASVNGFFIDIKSFRSHYDPAVDSASNRNEYQEHFLGGKGGRRVRLTTLPPSCAVVMKSGNLNFLESSGPLQACNGTALPLPLNRNVITNVAIIWKVLAPTEGHLKLPTAVRAHSDGSSAGQCRLRLTS